MIVNKIAKSKLIQFNRIVKTFSGAPKIKYDWRDDHTINPDLQRDSRMVGVRHYSQYTYPHRAPPLQWLLSHPNDYNPKNLHTNMVGAERGQIFNYMEVPSTDIMADAAHEFDYESQDCDFQAESFESQHFRKKGPIWMWVIVGLTPFWFFYLQLFYQEWPDEDNWRYQRPAPLEFPDDSETPDREIVEVFKTKEYRDLYDAAVVKAPFMQIKDGKKVYSKWAGVNDPIEAF